MKRQLVNIFLHGALGQEFGSEWKINAIHPAEALRGIDVNTKGRFRRYLQAQGKGAFYRMYLKDENNHIGAEELTCPSGANDIHLVPVVEGSNSGWGKILTGVALLAATGAVAFFSGGTIQLWQYTVPIAGSLILGGITQLLTPVKKSGGELNSNVFQGNVATAQQGGSVPIVYGTALVSPIPVSIKFRNVPYSTTFNTYVGTLQVIGLPGGGTEYIGGPTMPVQTTSDGG